MKTLTKYLHFLTTCILSLCMALIIGSCSDDDTTNDDDQMMGSDDDGGTTLPGVTCDSELETPSTVDATVCSNTIAGIKVVFIEPVEGTRSGRLAVFFPGKDRDAEQLRFGLAGGIDLIQQHGRTVDRINGWIQRRLVKKE